MPTPLGGLFKRLSSAFERRDIATAGALYGDPYDDEDMIRPTATRYAPLREAVERRVGTFLRQDLVSHLEIGFSEIFQLHYIEVAAADAQGAAVLAQFLHEFSPEARVRWVKKLLGPAVGQHVSVEQFLGLDREFTAEALAETDPFEEKLNQGSTVAYRVILHGRWESKPTMPTLAQGAGLTAHPTEQPETEREAGPRLRLSVRDASSPNSGNDGARSAEIDHFPAVLGSSVHADVEISGYYVSARHCTLQWEGQQLWLSDHSTNGTWVDGERVHRGKRVAVANGALIGFGRDQGDGDYDRYPVMHAHVVRNPVGSESSATPVSPSRLTPVAPVMPLSTAIYGQENIAAPLAVLAITDASGNPTREVLKLPFTIGRGSAQDYVVPAANHGVSREHLVIEEINPTGAVTVNLAASRNGTFSGRHALPERFVWRFGQEIVLGERWTDAPALRIALQQVE